jgi:hypothetical protein
MGAATGPFHEHLSLALGLEHCMPQAHYVPERFVPKSSSGLRSLTTQRTMYKWHVHSAIGRGRPLANDFSRVADGIAASLRAFSISASKDAPAECTTWSFITVSSYANTYSSRQTHQPGCGGSGASSPIPCAAVCCSGCRNLILSTSGRNRCSIIGRKTPSTCLHHSKSRF